MVTRGREFSADEAATVGLINKVFEEAVFEEAVKEYVAAYKNVSGSAVQLSKKLLYRTDAATFADALEMGAKTNAEARMTDDCQKGITKFLKKD